MNPSEQDYVTANNKLNEQVKAFQEAAQSATDIRSELRKMGAGSLRERKLANRRKMREAGHKPKEKIRYTGSPIDRAHALALDIEARRKRKEQKNNEENRLQDV